MTFESHFDVENHVYCANYSRKMCPLQYKLYTHKLLQCSKYYIQIIGEKNKPDEPIS